MPFEGDVLDQDRAFMYRVSTLGNGDSWPTVGGLPLRSE
jgi:hypothetical protein